MKKRIIILILICGSFVAGAQDFKDTAFQHITITTTDLPPFDIHVTKSYDDKKKPLIIYLDGSGNFPLYYPSRTGKVSSSIAMNIRKYHKDYLFALISKPNIPFYDSLRYTETGRPYYPANDLYRQLYSLDWRAITASEAIDYLVQELPVDPEQVIVMGYSEGSQVAPMVGVMNKKVTHVVCFVGNALNQLYDFILEARLNVERGQLTPDQGQNLVDSLYKEYEKIYADPYSVTKSWYGATYRKWASFSTVTPLENMLHLTIPILYIGGGRDNNQTIMDMDYARLEFLRHGKTNLTYKVYPNCDHYFREVKNVQGRIEQVDRIDEVNEFAIQWIKANPRID
jgi:pimeloyl-ACP methyl ester carboxylesterase